MKNLFDATVVSQIKTRLGTLEPQSERRWGKMTVAQMLAHCSVSMQPDDNARNREGRW